MKALKLLVQYGAAEGLSDALGEASRYGDVKSVKLLLENGADVEHGIFEQTPLSLASEGGHIKIVELFLRYGAKTDYVDGSDGGPLNTAYKSPLMRAAEKGYVDIVKLLLQNGADVNLIGKGFRADPAYKRPDTLDAFGYSFRNQHSEVAELLLQNGAHYRNYSNLVGGKENLSPGMLNIIEKYEND